MSSSKQQKMSPQMLDVVDGVGDFIEYWGFKRVQGRIWALIFLAEQPVDARYLMEHLQISKALVSLSIKVLLEYDVILISPEKRGTVHYLSNPNLSDVIINVVLSREAKMLLKIKNSCELLARKTTAENVDTLLSATRLKQMQKMVQLADKALRTFTTLKQLNFKDLSQSLNFSRK